MDHPGVQINQIVLIKFEVQMFQERLNVSLSRQSRKRYSADQGPNLLGMSRYAAPEHKIQRIAVKHESIISARAPRFLFARHQISDQFPSGIGEFVTLCHAGLQPDTAAIFPERTFSYRT